MFTPKQYNDTIVTKNEQAAIEEHVDAHLKAGRLDIPVTRSGWQTASVAAVADKYILVGWRVEFHPERGVMMRFSMPETTSAGYVPGDGPSEDTPSDIGYSL
jgi:hypothetical protein